MNARLMFRDRDFELYEPPVGGRHFRKHELDRETLLCAVLWNAPALVKDLEIDTLLRAMARGDGFVFEVAQQTLLSGCENDMNTVLFRQAVLRDGLANPAELKELYGLMTAIAEQEKKQWWSLSGDYPSSMLYSSVELMNTFVAAMRELRRAAERHAPKFSSEGFVSLFAMLKKELSDPYLATVEDHLQQLMFRKGILLSAELGDRNEGANYTLRKPAERKQGWIERILGKGPVGFTFHLDPRDEAGGRIVSDMRNRGIARVARALRQSADHVSAFFKMLRTELAFYVGCINLHEELATRGTPTVFPAPRPSGEHGHLFTGLYDVALALTKNQEIVGNDLNADGKNLVVITGANQGGKSTFLRSVGLAQIMMQCGLFVGAESFSGSLCPALITHFKREEDTTMKSGKFDEELARMREIADHIVPQSTLLFNESFAATNDREGADIAQQIVRALCEQNMTVFYVTHLYDFASHFVHEEGNGTVFLRAERKEDGSRSFRLFEGRPLDTSYGEDLYREVFQIEKPLN